MATRKKRKVRKAAARRASPRRKRRVVRRRGPSAARRSPAVRVQRRGRTVYASNPRKRRVRRYRRNPAFGRGMLNTVIAAGKDAAAVLGGMAATNFIARKIPFGEGNKAIEVGKKVAVAILIGTVANRFLGKSLAEKVTIGGLVAVGADLLRNVPVVGVSLAGDDDLRFMARSGMAAWPTALLPSGGVSGYAGRDGWGGAPEAVGSLASYYS